jgi:transposase-like protein
MGTPRFRPEFKEEAVRQIAERGYSVPEVSDRLGCTKPLQMDTGYQT